MTWSLVYAWAVGICYAAFTALVLDAMGKGSAATKYTIYASLSNFPIWWVGLALGKVADDHGPVVMLLAEAGLAVAGLMIFLVTYRALRQVPKLVDA